MRNTTLEKQSKKNNNMPFTHTSTHMEEKLRESTVKVS